MIAIIDYGVGNLFSLSHSLTAVGAENAVTGDPDTGWGWYQKKGFDLVQTDHLAAAKAYYERQSHDDV